MKIQEYFNDLNARERKLVILASIFCGIFIFYSFVYAPLGKAVEDKKLILQENKQSLVWMEQVYAKQKLVKPPETLPHDKLLTALSNSIRNSDLKNFPYQLEQDTSGDIRLNFAKVPYNIFVNWLWQFSSRYALSLKVFTVTPKGQPGIVEASVVLGF